MGSRNFLKVIVQNFDVLAGYLSGKNESFAISSITQEWLLSIFVFYHIRPLVTLAYPLYASIRAIESKSRADDKQWLTYWVLYSLVTLFELTFAKVIEWFPIWPYAKLIATCWLVLPHFNGASYVYEHFIRPCIVNAQTVNIWYIPRKKGIFSKPDDILTAAEKYIEENGPEEFERLISKTNRVSRSRRNSRRNSSYTIPEEANSYNCYDSYDIFHQPVYQSYT